MLQSLSGYLLGILPLSFHPISFRVWLHCLVRLASWSPIELITGPSVRTAFSSFYCSISLSWTLSVCCLSDDRPFHFHRWVNVERSACHVFFVVCVCVCVCVCVPRKGNWVVKENPKLTGFFFFFFLFFSFLLFLSFPGKVHHTLKAIDKHRAEKKNSR